jgi:pyruvate carboxylase
MNAIVTALQGSERDTGMCDELLLPISEYWEHVRGFYSKFEEGLTSPATDIYKYEIPGGQYSNLKPQVVSLGLGDRFHDVKEKYKEVNDMLGDIVKVTPSSKMVGDMAIFMVQNDLDASNIVKKGKNLAFPDSVVSYFEGMMGQPQGGFPADIQKIVLKGTKPITCRPGELLPSIDFNEAANQMKPLCPSPEMRDVVSYCLYPNVLKSFYAQAEEYSDLSNLDTPVFFNGLTPGETTEVEIEAGKTLIIKLIGIGDINEDGLRSVEFELNGFRREIMVPDMSQGPIKTSFVEADPNNPLELGSNIPGMISKLQVSEGEKVKKNDVVAIIEAMKMETAIVSNIDGIIDKIHVKERQAVKVKELLITMRPK